MLSPRPKGLKAPINFGAPAENRATSRLPMRDEIYLQTRAQAIEPPVASFGVDDPLPILRTRSNEAPVLLEGDGEGVVDAAGAGYLGGGDVVISAPALASRPSLFTSLLRRSSLLVTDTNRKQAARWGTVRDNVGYTERSDEKPLAVDPSDSRLPLFPGAPVSAYTTVEQRGVTRIEATSYGNPVSYTPADRPANAFDGDPTTAWVVGALGPVGGQKLLLEAAKPVTTDHLDIVQADQGPRRITRLGVYLDGRRVTDAPLDDRSLTGSGARVDLGGRRTFKTLELVIERDNVGRRPSYADQNGVGLAEVGVGGVHVDEVVKLPTDLLTRAAEQGADGLPLTIVLTRLRANPQEPFARDAEPRLVRSFDLPAEYSFGLTGAARVHANLADDALDRLVGGRLGVTVRSSGRLAGDIGARASVAIDGDAATAWTNRFGDQVGAWIEVDRAAATTIDHLDLRALDDGDHSVPTRVTVSNESGERRTLDVPAAVTTLRFPALTGRVTRLTIDAVRPVTTTDWFSKGPSTMPVAIAELGIAPVPASAGSLGGCRSDLLTVDGRPVPLQVQGATVTTCEGVPFHLTPGTHDLRTAPGAATGIDVDQLVLSTQDPNPTPVADPSARVSIRRHGRVSFDVDVRSAKPTWLVLGQSWSKGWKATVDGKDIGRPVLVDGYANGWLVDPGAAGAVTVHLQWTPQRLVWAGLGTSVLGVLLCLVILVGSVLGARRARVAVAANDGAAAATLRDHPLLSGAPVGWARTVVLAVGLGVAVGLLTHPFIGLATIPVAGASLRVRHGRFLGPLAAGLLAIAGGFTALREARRHLPADFGWTDYFRPAHNLAWAALAALVVLVVVDAVRRRDG
jgi:hypothetical protein